MLYIIFVPYFEKLSSCGLIKTTEKKIGGGDIPLTFISLSNKRMIDKQFFVISLLVIFLLALSSYVYELSRTDQMDVVVESDRLKLEADFGEMRKQYAEMKHHVAELEGRLASAEAKQQVKVEPNVYTNHNGIITVVEEEPPKPPPKSPVLKVLVPKNMNDKPVAPIPVGGTKLSEEHVGAGQYTTCQMPEETRDINEFLQSTSF